MTTQIPRCETRQEARTQPFVIEQRFERRRIFGIRIWSRWLKVGFYRDPSDRDKQLAALRAIDAARGADSKFQYRCADYRRRREPLYIP